MKTNGIHISHALSLIVMYKSDEALRPLLKSRMFMK